jgi:AcrR family transcriptional regulator
MGPAATHDDAAKRELVTLAMTLIEQRGKAPNRTDIATAAGISRTRIEAIFPEEDDLFSAVADHWYADDITCMEEVVRSELPIRRKFYEFYARRFVRERQRFLDNPSLFALYCELGEARFELVRGFIDLADHYLTELIAQAQDEGYFQGLEIDHALTLINQMLVCYTSPQMLMIVEPRLSEKKLAGILDTAFNGLSGEVGTCGSVAELKEV